MITLQLIGNQMTIPLRLMKLLHGRILFQHSEFLKKNLMIQLIHDYLIIIILIDVYY